MVCHSKEGTSEVANEVVLGGVLHIGDHRYVSNWAVSDCRYNICLGMPWHVEKDVKICYCARTIEVPGADLHLPKPKEKDEEIQVSNMSAEKFRSLLRKNYGSHKL